jgi:hypothetical protein
VGLLEPGGRLDDLDQVRDEVVPALQFDVHLPPRLADRVALADEPVADENASTTATSSTASTTISTISIGAP